MLLRYILEIASHLNNYENDRDLRNIVTIMKDKFLQYWCDIPMLYAFAFILDPRAKMKMMNPKLTMCLVSFELSRLNLGCYIYVVATLLAFT
jgi:hypothetical protein